MTSPPIPAVGRNETLIQPMIWTEELSIPPGMNSPVVNLRAVGVCCRIRGVTAVAAVVIAVAVGAQRVHVVVTLVLRGVAPRRVILPVHTRRVIMEEMDQLVFRQVRV